MVFKYKAIEASGKETEGIIDAPSKDLAILALQRRNLIIVSVAEEDEKPFFERNFSLFERVSLKDVVIISRQISTLFEAQVSAVKAFRLLGGESENLLLREKLSQIADDVQAGVPISGALGKHPDIFSAFYVNMVRAGEESGKLNETFLFLADYLDRSYELTVKTRNALIYPVFVVVTFIAVMVLMLTLVIPKLSAILVESGQDIPFYTKIVVGMSQFLIDYGIFFLVILVVAGLYLWRLRGSEGGRLYFDSLKLSIPYVSDLYRKLYLSRIADNMDTMLGSGISMLRAVEITASVVDNRVYENLLRDVQELVKGGSAVSDAFSRYPVHIPAIMVQMVKVGEETGELGFILKTLAKFYRREVENAVDTLVGLIEPVLIVLLGLGVGLLLTSVLVPIYNIAGGI
ncbi:MAG: type II secretion system F family protein [bacterium]|nr:type II secretion system F family protein [bacterium]